MNNETKTDVSVKETKDEAVSFDFWQMDNITKMEEYSVFMPGGWGETDAVTTGDSSWGGD